MKLTNVYAPHEGYAESTKQKFHSNMKQCQNEMNKEHGQIETNVLTYLRTLMSRADFLGASAQCQIVPLRKIVALPCV